LKEVTIVKSTKKIIIILLILALISSASLVLTSCKKDEQTPERVFFTTTKTYYVDDLSIMQMGSLPMLVIDTTRSYLRFGADGSFSLRLALSKDGIEMINFMLSSGVVDFEKLDLNYILETYLAAMFPGFNRQDFQGSLRLAYDSMGLRFFGTDTPAGNALLDKLETGDFEGLEVPYPFGIEITSVYRLKTVHSDYSGDWNAIFIGNYDETVTPNPYMIFTIKENEAGVEYVYTILEILNARLTASLRNAEDHA
jgi:hypothetical protein